MLQPWQVPTAAPGQAHWGWDEPGEDTALPPNPEMGTEPKGKLKLDAFVAEMASTSMRTRAAPMATINPRYAASRRWAAVGVGGQDTGAVGLGWTSLMK